MKNKTRATNLCSVALVSLLLGSPASAQAPPRTPVQSWAALPSVLKPRQRVIVTDNTGEKHSGRVASLGSQLALEVGRRPMIFAEDAIRQIHKDDSTWDGLLIGFGVGMALGLAVAKNGSPQSEGTEAELGVAIAVAAAFAGGWLDGRIHRLLYVSPHPLRISLAPLIDRTRVGVAAALRF